MCDLSSERFITKKSEGHKRSKKGKGRASRRPRGIRERGQEKRRRQTERKQGRRKGRKHRKEE